MAFIEWLSMPSLVFYETSNSIWCNKVNIKIDVIDVFDDITIMLTSKITLDIITVNNMNWIQI